MFEKVKNLLYRFKKILIILTGIILFPIIPYLLMILLAVYHWFLVEYQKIFLEGVLGLNENIINIGIIGDSLAVLSFIALIYSLILNIKELRLNREEFEKSNKIRTQELKQNKKQSEIDNKLRAKCEVLENLRSLGENRDSENKRIISFNLAELVQSSLETLVKIRREEKDEYLLEFARNFIEKNKGNLRNIDFSGQNFREAILKDARFGGANLRKTQFWKANLKCAHFLRANLRKAKFWKANLKGARFWWANLKGADFYMANLKGAEFMGADLKGAYFRDANLKGANFIDVDFSFAKNLTIKQLSQAKTLYKAKLDPELLEQVKQKCPELLEKPDN